MWANCPQFLLSLRKNISMPSCYSKLALSLIILFFILLNLYLVHFTEGFFTILSPLRGFLLLQFPSFWCIPGSPGFKRCLSCQEAILVSNRHSWCIHCLGETHIPQKSSICSAFKCRARKNQEIKCICFR